MAIDGTDKNTKDLFESRKGRPRKYSSNAEKQRAYRERKRMRAEK